MVAHGLTFPFAVRIPDWNHIIMSTIRNASEAIECWPRFLAEMCSLTKCFRDEDYRVCQLAPLASFVQQGFLGAFHNTKPEGLDEACKDVELWVFIQAVAPFMQKADRLRPWGGAVVMRQSCCVDKSCVREKG